MALMRAMEIRMVDPKSEGKGTLMALRIRIGWQTPRLREIPMRNESTTTRNFTFVVQPQEEVVTGGGCTRGVTVRGNYIFRGPGAQEPRVTEIVIATRPEGTANLATNSARVARMVVTMLMEPKIMGRRVRRKCVSPKRSSHR